MALVDEAPVEDTASTPTDGLAWDLSWDTVDQWGAQSFPASDPPANW